MDYEKEYKAAIGRARNLHKDAIDMEDSLRAKIAEIIFPELKESEGEKKLKESLMQYLWDMYHKDFVPLRPSMELCDKWLAWLEKQDEQKTITNTPSREAILSIWDLGNEWKELTKGRFSEKYGTQLDYIQKHWQESEYYKKQCTQKTTDMIKLKFKVGDWIVATGKLIYKVIEIREQKFDESYILIDTDNNEYEFGIQSIECDGRLWTIQDAEDGDVLACKSGWTCIFKTLVNDETFSSYCFMDNTKWFWARGSECHTLNEAFLKVYNGKIYPATKEQRDLLFQKMKEAGYEWDADNKYLINI